MSNLKEIRTRIVSVNSTKQITNAMKMVAASKLRKAQRELVSLRPYNDLQIDFVDTIIKFNPNSNFFAKSEVKNKNLLLIAIASNRGLCGGFNINMAKKTADTLKNYSENYTKIKLITIGQKITEILKDEVSQNFDDIFNNINFNRVAELSNFLNKNYLSGNYSEIKILYYKFHNAANQAIVEFDYLPIIKIADNELVADKELIVEPDLDITFDNLLKQSLKTKLYRIFIESLTSEHGTRMMSMQQATDNANDLIKELKLNYNKARQASITNEIMEIVSGAEALKNIK